MSCEKCLQGWTCEKHYGTPWPHPALSPEDASTSLEPMLKGMCAGPGMPCPNGCAFHPIVESALKNSALMNQVRESYAEELRSTIGHPPL